MELFQEKRLDRNRGFKKKADILTQKRLLFLEKQMKELKKCCVELYEHHSYYQELHDYEKTLTCAREIYHQIQQTEWDKDQEDLDIFKAKAGYFIGTAYKEKGAYDNALGYLKEARQLIEKRTFQKVIPEFYVGICMGMAKCYMEKHSPLKWINECHQTAQATLEKNQKKIERAYSKFFFLKLTLELELQQAIAELDIYGQKRFYKYSDAWKCLQNAEKHYEKISAREDRLCKKNKFLYHEWKEKQDDTLQTTKGEFLKKLYFEARKQIEKAGILDDVYLNYILTVLIAEIETRLRHKKENYLEETLKELKGMSDHHAEKDYIKVRNICFEMAFSIFAKKVAKQNNNTICLGNMAALLYDYKDKKENVNLEPYYRDFNQQYLSSLIDRYCKDFDKIVISGEEDIEKNIKTLLNRVIHIESSNMFALNILSALEYTKAESGKSSKIEHYPALRQSFLKKRFSNMYNCIHYGEIEVRKKDEENLKTIETLLIRMHSEVTSFMNEAIINFSDAPWRNLEVGHYTRLEVLPKLVNKEGNGKMRIQNVHYLNDPTEGVLLIERLKEKFPANLSEGSLSNMVFQKYDSDKRGTVRNSVYMGSFTSRLDQLNMWTRYGDGGKGCSIQIDCPGFFDQQAKVSLAETSTDENFEWYVMDDIKYPLYMVVYLPDDPTRELKDIKAYAESRAKVIANGEEEQSQIEIDWWKKQAKLIEKLDILQKELNNCFEGIQSAFDLMDKSSQSSIRQELCNTMMVILDLIRFLVKSENYQDEREFRIIQYEADPKYDKDAKEIPKLYTEVKKNLAYKKVCFGPLVQDFDSHAAYVLNIKKERSDGEKKKTWGIEVCKSGIQYR